MLIFSIISRVYMGYCQEENEKQETKNADELKATIK